MRSLCPPSRIVLALASRVTDGGDIAVAARRMIGANAVFEMRMHACGALGLN